MKISDIQLGERKIVEVLVKNGDSIDRLALLSEVELFSPDFDGSVLLRIGQTPLRVEAVDEHQRNMLDLVMERNLPRVAWIISSRPPENGEASRLTVEIREFPSSFVLPETVDFGVDENTIESVRRKNSADMSVSRAIEWLGDKFIATSSGEESLVLISGGPSPEKDKNSFRIHGKGFAADICRTKEADGRTLLLVCRIVQARHSQDEARSPVSLVRGKFQFKDRTIAGVFSGSARIELERILGGEGSYLKLWKECSDIERRNTETKAKAFGWIRYEKRYLQTDGVWCFEIAEPEGVEEKIQLLHEGGSLSLQAATRPPEVLAGDRFEEVEDFRKKQRFFSGEFIRTTQNNSLIELRNTDSSREKIDPPEKGCLFIDLAGERTKSERREKAQRKILSAQCPMPQLGLLMEGKPVPSRRSKEVRPLSSGVRSAFGGMEPTGRQIEALRVALSTPDIALIQGPPGTGKTRIIAALVARLSETAKDTRGLSGRYLLTSAQHDAVENVADATRVFGLPATKIGRKRGKAEDTDGFERWRQERVETVKAQLAGFDETPVEIAFRRCRDRVTGYIESTRRSENIAQLLNEIAGYASAHISGALKDKILEMRQSFERMQRKNAEGENEEAALALKALRSLRTDPASFADDGPRQAMKALLRLEKLTILEDAGRRLLEEAANWEDDAEPPFLKDLERFQSFLIDSLLPEHRPVGAPQVNQDVMELLNSVVDALRDRVRISVSGVSSALHEYVEDLENDVAGTRETVERYTAVLASTCQQSVARDMEKLKGDGMVFETVIVDEAARANPLDLFIPMSLGERRIILVGDHRQLPHLLEPEISREIEKTVKTEMKEMLEKSLFERLFKMMQEREKKDGIKRTVTLDVQYRMHPILGKFVSDAFYEEHGEAFGSSISETAFSHGLKEYGNAVAVWADIPLARGGESGGVSKKRAPEAKWIASEANRILCERPDFSVGVISFYSEQVTELHRQMARLRMTEEKEDGSYQIAEDWRTTRDSSGALKERLRIGTVDSFQGKEFDVVLLSVTRSNSLQSSDEKARRRKFGHLMLANRLCVAMSRQKRLLIAAGDSGMLRSDGATEAIGALCKFYELCGGPHGRIVQA